MSHTGTMISGEVTCDCGWKSGHYAFAQDAALAHDQHIKESEETRVIGVDDFDRLDQILDEVSYKPCSENEKKAVLALLQHGLEEDTLSAIERAHAVMLAIGDIEED